jgi:hypothetical protein
MVDQIAGPVAFTTPGAPTTTFDITHVDITETCKAAILIHGTGNLAADDAAYTTGRMGIALLALENGVNIGGTISQIVRNGLATPQARNAHGLEGIRLARNSGFLTQFDCIAATPSATPGGLRLDVTDATQVVKGAALLFAGSGMRAWAGTLQATVVSAHENTGPTSPSDTRFQPDIVIVIGCKEAAISAGQSSDCVIGLGAALPGGAQTCSFVDIDTATEPSDADGNVRSARACSGLDAARAEGAVTITIDSTGFNYISDAGSPRFKYLAIKFERSRAGVASNPIAAATGLQSFNGFGFSPEFYVGLSTLLTSLDTLTDGPTASTAGYCMGNNRARTGRACAVAQEEGQSGTSAAGGREGNDGLLTLDHVGNLKHRASPDGPSGSGGFNLNFTTADAAGYFTAVGFQIIPSPPFPVHRRRAGRRRARGILRRRGVSLGAAPVSAPPLTRLLSLVARARRAMRARLRWKPLRLPLTVMPQVTYLEADEAKGIIAAPGLVRGHVFGPGAPANDIDQ